MLELQWNEEHSDSNWTNSLNSGVNIHRDICFYSWFAFKVQNWRPSKQYHLMCGQQLNSRCLYVVFEVSLAPRCWMFKVWEGISALKHKQGLNQQFKIPFSQSQARGAQLNRQKRQIPLWRTQISGESTKEREPAKFPTEHLCFCCQQLSPPCKR